ncbi:MAG: GH116 family glycosyl-hydrolase, partial [Thermodesulfobacteriota bacterium]
MQESKFTYPFTITGKFNHWQTFSADGFDQPVCGCVYDGSRLYGGVPLGGLGTGYVTLEGTGHLGRASLFNHFPKPHYFDLPFIGLTIGSELRVISLKPPQGLKGAQTICYWGHFPFADLRVDLDLPLQLGIRAFTPFILGDAKSSNVPAALFEMYLYNAGQTELSGRLAFSFPGPPKEQDVSPVVERRSLRGAWTGTEIVQKRGTGYALATSVREGVYYTSYFGEGEGDWHDLLKEEIRPAKPDDVGASVVVDVRLLPQEESSVRFVLGWFYPYFRDTTHEPHTHHYIRNFSSAGQVAQFSLTHFDMLIAKSLSWQREIYRSDFPIWLKDLLVNSLYSYAKNTLWVVSDRPDNWNPEVGFFTHSESFTGCPITETMVCRMHGHLPTLFFFPELEYSTLYAFKHFQITDGEIPFSF